MGNRRFSIVVLVMLATAVVAIPIAAAQQDAAPRTSRPLAVVSFDLFHNRVYLPVQVNGQVTISMILDTGAAYSGVSESTAQAAGVRINKRAQLTGNGESNQRIGLAQNVRFSVGDVDLIEKTIAVVPFEQLEASEGRSIAGVLGVDLFRRYVVVIDYAAKRLSLFAPSTFAYRGSGTVVPLHFRGAALFHASIVLPGETPLAAEIAIDSGTYSALRIYRPFAEKHDSLQQLEKQAVPSFGFGVGGEFPERILQAGSLAIGAIQLRDPLISISDAIHGATASNSYDGTIGGAILRRFTVILDYSRAQMILEPNASLETPFNADESGLILSASGSDFKTISVRHVIADTAAARAGIREGDLLQTLNGQTVGELGLEAIRTVLCQPGVYYLVLQRGSTILHVDVANSPPKQ